MELRNLITFLRAAKLESFTKTAEELNYVQSTVTMQIRQLETELGYPLFDRIGKKVFLSQKGKELLPYAEQIVQAMHNATQIKSPSSEVKGVLHLGILESLFTSVFSGLIPGREEKDSGRTGLGPAPAAFIPFCPRSGPGSRKSKS